MSGWLRHLALSAQARTGLSSPVIVWAVVAAVAAIAAGIFLCVAAFIWLTDRYGAMVASLAMAGFFVLVALIALIVSMMTRRRNIEQARLELAARSRANWLDPQLLAMGFQVGRTIGWRKVASLAAVGLLAAGVAKEWFGRDAKPQDGEDASSED